MFTKRIIKKIIQRLNGPLIEDAVSRRLQKTIFPLITSLRKEADDIRKDVNDITSHIDRHAPSFLRERDKRDLQMLFRARLGIKLNLDTPVTFNEKHQWLKINCRKPEMSIMVDKYRVRELLTCKGYSKYLNTLYGVYRNTHQLLEVMDTLPTAFVVKANHWSGGNVIVRDKDKLDIAELRRLDALMEDNYYFKKVKVHLDDRVCLISKGEWPYKDIEPCLVVEKYLEDGPGTLTDYKIFCFNGTPRYIQLDIDRFKGHTRCFYDTHWNKQDFTIKYPLFKGHLPQPRNLNEMLEVSEDLAQDYPYLRVDFYLADDRLIFGELTFFHESGTGEFYPNEWDKRLGDLIDLKI